MDRRGFIKRAAAALTATAAIPVLAKAPKKITPTAVDPVNGGMQLNGPYSTVVAEKSLMEFYDSSGTLRVKIGCW